MLEATKKGGVFVTVLADGKFHQTVDAGTASAVLREGEDKDGVAFSKWELVFDALSGVIGKVDLVDGKFGMNLNIEIDGATASFSTSGNFGEDMLKKILNIDLSKPVRLVPYSITEGEKTKKGVTVYQGEKKVQSYFHSYDTGTKKTTPINGYPEMPVAKGTKKISSDEWKMFFMKARLFMIDQVSAKFSANGVEVVHDSAPVSDTYGFEEGDL